MVRSPHAKTIQDEPRPIGDDSAYALCKYQIEVGLLVHRPDVRLKARGP
jgi:hypothetical protein